MESVTVDDLAFLLLDDPEISNQLSIRRSSRRGKNNVQLATTKPAAAAAPVVATINEDPKKNTGTAMAPPPALAASSHREPPGQLRLSTRVPQKSAVSPGAKGAQKKVATGGKSWVQAHAKGESFFCIVWIFIYTQQKGLFTHNGASQDLGSHVTSPYTTLSNELIVLLLPICHYWNFLHVFRRQGSKSTTKVT